MDIKNNTSQAGASQVLCERASLAASDEAISALMTQVEAHNKAANKKASAALLLLRAALAACATDIDGSEDLPALDSPSLKPGAAFMVDMDSALRHAEAFYNGQIATSIVRELVLRHQP